MKTVLRRKIVAFVVVQAIAVGLVATTNLFDLSAKGSTGKEFFVSPNGNDKNDGSIASPWKTIAKAQEEIRKIKSDKAISDKGITVWLRGGRYAQSGSLSFTAADNGTATCPIAYKAYQQEKVSLFNGKMIEFDKWHALSADARKRVHPKVNPERLLELSLSDIGYNNVPTMPDKYINWPLFDFVVNNKRQLISQWPNLNENIRGKNDPGWVTCNGSKDVVSFFYGKGGQPTDKDDANEVEMDGTQRIERWKRSMADGHGLWLKGFWRIPWEAHTVKIADIDANEQWIRLTVNANNGMGSKYSPNAAGTTAFRIGDGKEKYCLINALDEIDQPGEWAYDAKDKKLYYYPVQNFEKADTYLANSNKAVLSVNNAAYLQFVGLTIEGSQGNGIDLNGASNVEVSGCDIRNVGASGINEVNGKSNLFRSNTIFATGGTGITVQNCGNRPQLIASNDQFINNYIHHTGELSYLYAVVVKNSVGVRFANNLIHDIPAGGFSTLLINNSIFEYNEIHNIALKVSDMGAYYGYGGWSCYGNEIRYNFIHHINRSNGLYSDDGTSGKNFHHNIVQGAVKPLLFGGGHHNIANNNLFIACASSGSTDDRGIARKYWISNNYGKAIRDMNPDKEPWKSYGQQLMKSYNYPATDQLWECTLDTLWHPEWPNGCRMTDNVEVQSKGFSKAKNGTITLENNSSIATIELAGFKDYAKMDLRTSQPLILAKFPDLNAQLPKMGLQLDEFRRTLPTRAEQGGLVNRGTSGDKAYEDAVNR